MKQKAIIKKKKVVANMLRLNTRVTLKQKKFIKRLAKEIGKTEGELFRYILDEFISNNGK